MTKTYTAQCDAHGNWIVCGDQEPRRGYRIIFVGSYKDCCAIKERGMLA